VAPHAEGQRLLRSRKNPVKQTSLLSTAGSSVTFSSGCHCRGCLKASCGTPYQVRYLVRTYCNGYILHVIEVNAHPEPYKELRIEIVLARKLSCARTSWRVDSVASHLEQTRVLHLRKTIELQFRRECCLVRSFTDDALRCTASFVPTHCQMFFAASTTLQ